MADEGRITIPKVWRSEFAGIIVFLVLCIASVVLSMHFPASVMTGKLLTIGSTTFYLSLPLYWLVPFGWLSILIVRMYDVSYVADARGIEAYEGILSLRQKVMKVRYEDIRSIEFDQSLFERLLDVGEVDIGTAGLSSVEMVLCGVASPKAIQDFVQNERDRRQHIKPELDGPTPEAADLVAEQGG